MFLYMWVVDIKDILKLFNNTHVFDPNISVKTECWLTDSLVELTVNGVLDLGVSIKES